MRSCTALLRFFIMNETVLFLVIGAAVILVGLFLWSRMEAKKNSEGAVGLSRESKESIYGENGKFNRPKILQRSLPVGPKTH